MDSAAALAVVVLGLTSLGAYLIGRGRLGLAPARLRHAVGRTLDCVGLGIVFLLANLAIGAAVILTLRMATGAFVSMYILNDSTLLTLSMLQALVVQWWRDR